MGKLEEKLLVDEKEASEITGRPLPSLRNDRHNRRGLPYVKFGRAVRYALDDIQRYIEDHKIKFNNGRAE